MSAYDNLLDALRGDGRKVSTSSTSARSQCPAHDSTGLSLSVRQADDRALVHCFAGCVVEDVLAAIGWTLGDLYDEKPAGRYVPPVRHVTTPWEDACAGLGIRNPPPFDHVLDRIVQQQAIEDKRDSKTGPPLFELVDVPRPLLCEVCWTPTSPWSCSCGETYVPEARWSA